MNKILATIAVIFGIFQKAKTSLVSGGNRAYFWAIDTSREGWGYIHNMSWVKHSWASQKGEVGTAAITGLFIVGMMAFILYIVVANFWPSAQTANTAIQANTATDSGTTTSKTFFSMGLWIIPVGIFVCLFVLLIKRVQGK